MTEKRQAMKLNTIPEIEEAMAEVMTQPGYELVVKRFHHLLNIMGNVDGDEVIALVLVAFSSRELG